LAADSDFPASLVVVGADGAYGSAKVAVDLGLSLAFDGQRVAVADFEGSGITRYLQMDGRERGASFFRRSDSVETAGITFDRFTLRAWPALRLVVPRVRPRGLSVEDAETVVSELSADADIMVVHVPPPTRLRGALTWGWATAGTLLVVDAGQTKRRDLAEAVETLEPIGPKLLGAVLQTTASNPPTLLDERRTHGADWTRPRSGAVVRSRAP
jgi:Mrp family chromosome partitioning ATPase